MLHQIVLGFQRLLKLTVRNEDLQRCETNRRVCVTDPADCGSPPAPRPALNVSCFYQKSSSTLRSMTCDWSREPGSRTEPLYSLIFSSKRDVVSCKGIFNPLAVLNVTVRIRNYLGKREVWSLPHTVDVYHAVKPPQPVLTVVNSTADSLVVSWMIRDFSSCQLRYRVDTSHTWTQAAGSVQGDGTLVYRVTDLQPFTVYRSAVACRLEVGYRSDWSADATGRTLERGDTPHSTRHTPHATLHTPHATRHTPHSTLHTPHSTLHTPHSTLHTPHSTLHTPHSTLHTPHAAKKDIHLTAALESDCGHNASLTTSGGAPSRPPEACYRLEKTGSGGSLLLHLMWKALDLHEAGGRILGYRVSYAPTKEHRPRRSVIRNVTELTAPLVAEERYWSVSVSAFNTAGHGPAAQLSIDTHTQHIVPSVRNLWVSAGKKGLQVRWELAPPPPQATPPPSASDGSAPLLAPPSVLPVSHFVVQWSSESRPAARRWSRADGFTSTVTRDQLDSAQSYSFSVSSVSQQQCGAPQSLPASLEHGALLEAVRLKIVGVTKTTAAVVWAWQRENDEPIRVDRYTLVLRRASEERALPVWPDQWQHTFLNLTPSTEYSVLLLADNATRVIIPIRTAFDESTAVAAVTPLLLLAVSVLIVSILSRTVYKSYFFPPISSPQSSTTGQWLMEANHQKTAERKILAIEDFQVRDVLGKKSLIVVGPDSRPAADEDLDEHTPPPSLSHLIIKYSDTDYIADAPAVERKAVVSLQSYNPDYVVNCHLPEIAGFPAEESVSLLPCQTDDVADSHFPEKQEESRQVGVSQMSRQTENVNCPFQESVGSGESLGLPQLACETEYVLNSYFMQKTAVEAESLPCSL
ncbi:interleukin-6 receptor subunit beta [Centroberyx affinis]|uniref:interleukin-6 receptor subunit beta n=1 Tax=Centroberyx affinis TaxID=166261 RepID=UPI003A5C46C6